MKRSSKFALAAVAVLVGIELGHRIALAPAHYHAYPAAHHAVMPPHHTHSATHHSAMLHLGLLGDHRYRNDGKLNRPGIAGGSNS